MKKYYIIIIAFLGCLGLQAKDMTGLKIYELSSAQVSLTSVFGMGTGGSSPSSTPAIP